jgi:hypothetical protein
MWTAVPTNMLKLLNWTCAPDQKLLFLDPKSEQAHPYKIEKLILVTNKIYVLRLLNNLPPN